MCSGRTVGNSLLIQIPEIEFAMLEPYLEFCDLHKLDVLEKAGAPISSVYFLSEGMGSMIVETSDGRSVEVGLAGRENMIGLALTGGLQEFTYTVVVQVPGSAFRISARTFTKLLPSLPALHRLLVRRLAIRNLELAQNAACNRLHSIKERLSRWLLLTHDRMDSDLINSTHDFLSKMVGTDRPTVTMALSQLEKTGAIRQQRGAIAIVSRERLEKSACECYGLSNRFNRELGLRT